MKRLIVHMWKYNYFPFDVRKPVKMFKNLLHSVLTFLRIKVFDFFWDSVEISALESNRAEHRLCLMTWCFDRGIMMVGMIRPVAAIHLIAMLNRIRCGPLDLYTLVKQERIQTKR